MKLRNTLLAIFASLTFTSCFYFEDDEDEIVSIIEMVVASETIEKTAYKALDASHTYLEEYLSVREHGSSRWTEFGLFEIEGFKFDDGYEYLLRVRRVEYLNPPPGGQAITYELDEILSKEHVNRSIIKVERYWIGGNMAIAQGENLLVGEAEEIEADILSNMPPVNTYKSYKFIYTDRALTEGRMLVYTDNNKEGGIFYRRYVQGRETFYIQIAGYEYEYVFMNIKNLNGIDALAFVEDVTNFYIYDYPYLESARAGQIISYYE